MTRPESARPHPHPGFFLTLDGPDGAGKTTMVTMLVTWLREQGLDVVTCRDPGTTPLGEELRKILLHRDQIHPSLRSEMLLYMAGRAQLVDEVIRPSLAAGRVVVSDRFLLANLVYQGIAGGLPLEEIGDVGRISTAGLMPDLTLVIDVPPETARERIGPSRDRIEDRPEEYRTQVREGYRRAAREAATAFGCPFYPAPIVLIDATPAPETVFATIRSEVERVLACGPRS